MNDFRECVDNIEVVDVNQLGLEYTWNQRPHALSGVLKKIDRVMVNDEFLSMFPNAFTIFQPYRISDHSPAILKLPSNIVVKHKHFKFSNYIGEKEGFRNCVVEGWNKQCDGHKMFVVVKKLRMMKKSNRKLMWDKGNIHARVTNLRSKLDEVQKLLDLNPHLTIHRENERSILKEFNEAIIDEEKLLRQKSKVQWLQEGDNNISYFHKVVKGRANRSKIHAIMDQTGYMIEGESVAATFVSHYKNFLGSYTPCADITDPCNTFLKCIDPVLARHMIRQVTDMEIKDAMFDIDDSKSPGPNGYSSAFFKKA
ncbi:uncharacterized protein [Rutidosis leptorrhynchoides]|uniref:uncharacterized protein n=1 Tax=Rutidosis leptorrhynchoides TaxID=125765 RepID=UPI003A9A4677